MKMKRILMTMLMVSAFGVALATEPVELMTPSKNRGTSAQEALWNRQSVREWSAETLSAQDLSDLLWAAGGINRPDTPRGALKTAPSAMNKQDVKVYVLTDKAAYLYDAVKHGLTPLADGDYRIGCRGNKAAVDLVLVADEDTRWTGINSGYIAQNIYLFCAANGMATVSCGMDDDATLRKVLNLNSKQSFVLHNPVGYPVK